MRSALAFATVLMVSACSTLPRAAPTVKEVLQPIGGKDIRVIEITPELAASVQYDPKPMPITWTIPNAYPQSDDIGVGDLVSVTIYEVGYSLFSPEATTPNPEIPRAPAASTKTLPAFTVPMSGSVDLPFIGKIRVAGRTTDAVTVEIERRLKGKSQFAQALVTVQRGATRSVLLSGDIKQPGRVMLSTNGERLLDAIAIAGGPVGRATDTMVRLTRGAEVNEARLDALAPYSPFNVRLAPGDRIELTKSTRSLTVLGALKSVSEIVFDSPRLTLSEALSRAGGPEEDKADATGVFVFRYVATQQGDTQIEVPTIFRLNLLDARAYFAAQKFQMREKDVMLVASARSNSLGKFTQLLSSLTNPLVTARVLTR